MALAAGNALGAVLPCRAASAATSPLFGRDTERAAAWLKQSARTRLDQCTGLLQDVERPTTAPLDRLTALDRTSQLICSVIDGAELVRTVHPSPGLRGAAEEAFALMTRLISRLNTDPKLYHATAAIAAAPQFATFTEEARRTVQSLVTEFEGGCAVQRQQPLLLTHEGSARHPLGQCGARAGGGAAGRDCGPLLHVPGSRRRAGAAA